MLSRTAGFPDVSVSTLVPKDVSGVSLMPVELLTPEPEGLFTEPDGLEPLVVPAPELPDELLVPEFP